MQKTVSACLLKNSDHMDKTARIEKAYSIARERYDELGIDTEKAMEKLDQISLSLHCWQTDDVAGLERPDAALIGRRDPGNGKFPGQGPEPRGDPSGYGTGVQPSSRQASLQYARQLR